MPLHVNIAINDKHIESLTIGRMEEMRGKDRTHDYIIVADNGDTALFAHRYDEGARKCVFLGLSALERERKNRDQADT